MKESLKTAIFPLYEELAKIEQEKSYDVLRAVG